MWQVTKKLWFNQEHVFTQKSSSKIILPNAVFRYYIQPLLQMRILVFWDVTPCSWVNRYKHSFKASGSANPSTQHNINNVETSKHTTVMFSMTTKQYLLIALKAVGESFITRLLLILFYLYTLPYQLLFSLYSKHFPHSCLRYILCIVVIQLLLYKNLAVLQAWAFQIRVLAVPMSNVVSYVYTIL